VAIVDALARAWLALQAGAANLDHDNGASTVQLEVVKAWLESHGYDGDKVFSDDHPGEAREVCLRLWLEDLGIDSQVLSPQELEQTVEKVTLEKNLPPPITGKITIST